MEFEGRISRVLPVRTGTSQKGEWKVLPFVFEYFETNDQRWPDRVLLETMDTNIMAKIGAYLKKGADGKAVVENGDCVLQAELKCKVGFSHGVRQYDRQDGSRAIINNVSVYKFEVLGEGVATVSQQTGQQPAAAQPAAEPTKVEEDDLPF
jgi:hypothetical protein